MRKNDDGAELTHEQLLSSLERVREQVAELKARLEQIRSEQRRLQRHVHFQRWQKDQKLKSNYVIEEALAELQYLQTLDSPSAVLETETKLWQIKLTMSQFAQEQKMTFD